LKIKVKVSQVYYKPGFQMFRVYSAKVTT